MSCEILYIGKQDEKVQKETYGLGISSTYTKKIYSKFMVTKY